jgi:hypothetical protein
MAPGAPPPTAITSPLIATDLGEARKATTLATSRASMARLMLLLDHHLAPDALGDSLRVEFGQVVLGQRQARMDNRDVDPVRPQLVGGILGECHHGHVADAADDRS